MDIIFRIVSDMKKKKLSKNQQAKEALKKQVKEAPKLGTEDCNCNWGIVAETVDNLMQWIEELCEENHRLKKSIEKLKKVDN